MTEKELLPIRVEPFELVRGFFVPSRNLKLAS